MGLVRFAVLDFEGKLVDNPSIWEGNPDGVQLPYPYLLLWPLPRLPIFDNTQFTVFPLHERLDLNVAPEAVPGTKDHLEINERDPMG